MTDKHHPSLEEVSLIDCAGDAPPAPQEALALLKSFRLIASAADRRKVLALAETLATRPKA